VALSFEGNFKREGKDGPEFYCQFFNWKNQCAWVSWDRLEPWNAYEKILDKSKLTPSEANAW
jgi:hypothetical protein